MFIDYSTEPIDIVSKENRWLCTYRYEPFLKKWFYVEPNMKRMIKLVKSEDVPEIVLNHSKKVKYDSLYSYYAPIKTQIQINKGCNYKCKMCYASSSNFVDQEISLKELDMTFSKLKKLGVLRVNFVGGEPFFRKDFIEICKLARKHRLLYSFISNGIICGQNIEKYSWVIENAFNMQISCNGFDESYKYEYNSFNWLIAKKNITKVINKAKKSILSYVITENNYEDIPNFIQFASEINPTVIKFGTVCFSGRAKKDKAVDYYQNIVPKAKKIINDMRERYPHLLIQSQIDQGIDTPLWEEFSNDYRPFEFYFSPEGKDGFYIKVNGNIYPFPLLSEYDELKIGSIYDNFAEIWKNSEVLKDIRNVTFKNSLCGKLGCKKVCGLWSRSYAYAWSNDLYGKIPCLLTNWE